MIYYNKNKVQKFQGSGIFESNEWDTKRHSIEEDSPEEELTEIAHPGVYLGKFKNGYPKYNTLTAEEISLLNDKGSIGRGIRRKARIGDKPLAEDATDMVKGFGQKMLEGAGLGAVAATGIAAAPYVATAAAPYVSALSASANAPLLGAAVPGVTINNTLTAGFGADFLANRAPKIPGLVKEGKYMDAATTSAEGLLDLYGLGITGTLAKIPVVTNTIKKFLGTSKTIGKTIKDDTIDVINRYKKTQSPEQGIDLTRTRPSRKRVPKNPKFTEKDLGAGLTELTPINPGAAGMRKDLIKQINVGDTGFIQLLKKYDDIGRDMYYFSASVPENSLAAGKAFKYLENFIPKGGIIREARSLSNDSFYNVLRRARQQNKYKVEHDGYLPMNSDAVNRRFSNWEESSIGKDPLLQELRYYDRRSNLEAFKELNTMIKKMVGSNVPPARLRTYSDGTFGIDVPDILLIKQFRRGGILYKKN